jgi:hypothetical protein
VCVICSDAPTSAPELTSLREAVQHAVDMQHGSANHESADKGGVLARMGVEAEDVPVWQRDEYIDEIGTLNDNSAFSLNFDTFKQTQKGADEMYGSIAAARQEEDENNSLV